MLSLKHVYKTYQAKTHILRDMTYDFVTGQMHVVYGASGAGKTTLFKLLTTQIKPTSGEVIYLQKNIHSLKESELLDYRKSVGIIFQDYKLIEEWSLRKNISLPLEILGCSQSEIKEKVGLLAEQLEIESILDDYPTWVSGGQQQRAAVARALIADPKIIFADEPTGNLDRNHKQIILDILYKKATSGALVIISTHDESIIHAAEVQKHYLNKGQFEI